MKICVGRFAHSENLLSSNVKKLFLFGAVVVFCFLRAERLEAQTFATLYNFTGSTSDGSYPLAGLLLSSNTLYGTTYSHFGSSSSGSGTVFALKTNGTGFTQLHRFATRNTNSSGLYTNSNGANPDCVLVMSRDTLFGTTTAGGSSGYGNVFSVKTNGTGFTILHSFPSGNEHHGGLLLSGSTLYGTKSSGVFAIQTNGSSFTNLYSFSNSTGDNPYAGLVLSGQNLYGTTRDGGANPSEGTLFVVKTNGTVFSTLHNFPVTSLGTNWGGANPYGGLAFSGSTVDYTLYGTAFNGGNAGKGTIFSLRDTGAFSVLHDFSKNGLIGFHGPQLQLNNRPYGTNSDGIGPYANLILSGSSLYGTTLYGGSFGNGTVFAISTNGTGFTVLHDFSTLRTNVFGVYTNGDGAFPYGGLVLSGKTLYGTASQGGSSGYGAVFSISLDPPPLTIARSATNVVLSWPTYSPGVMLQSTTNLLSPIVWDTNLPSPVVVNGQNAVSNPIFGTQKFFRLSQ